MSSAPMLAAVAVWTFGIGVVVRVSARGFRLVTEALVVVELLVIGQLLVVVDAVDVVLVDEAVLGVVVDVVVEADFVIGDVVQQLLVLPFVLQHEAVFWLEVVDVVVGAIRSPRPKLKVVIGENMRSVFSNMAMFCLPSSPKVLVKGNMVPKVSVKMLRILS